MSERLAAVLSGIADAEIARVAAAAVRIADAALAGPPDVHDLISPHNDRRTLAIKRFSGIASAEGSKRRWSAVCKIVDLDVAPGSVSTWVRPENEQAVYQEEYFVNDSLRFRPARCYHTSIPLPGIAVLWLEDLTTAKGPPFTPADLAQMLRHLGEWNGFHAARAPSLRFKLGEDSVYTRWAAWNYDADLADFRSMRHRPEVRAMYGDRSIEIVFELRDLLLQINQRARTHPHALCFGDCNSGSLFLRRDGQLRSTGPVSPAAPWVPMPAACWVRQSPGVEDSAKWRKMSGTCLGTTLMGCWPAAGEAMRTTCAAGILCTLAFTCSSWR